MKILKNKIPIHLLILFWAILLAISIVLGIILLKNPYSHWHLLRHQTLELKLQWRQQHLLSSRFQKIRHDSILLEHRYHHKLQLLHQPIYLTTLLADLTASANAHKIQLTIMKPLKNSMAGELQLQKIHLDISGKELQVLQFLHLITQKNWLCDFQTLEMNPIAEGIRVQATFDIYYSTRTAA